MEAPLQGRGRWMDAISNHSHSFANEHEHEWNQVQRSAKRLVRGLVKFVPALAYLFCLALPGSCLARFTNLLADLCICFPLPLSTRAALQTTRARSPPNLQVEIRGLDRVERRGRKAPLSLSLSRWFSLMTFLTEPTCRRATNATTPRPHPSALPQLRFA